MSSCIYPGSFDPVTKGHVDIISRACELFDEVYVALLQNSAKKYMFSLKEREDMLKAVCAPHKNASIVTSEGLLADVMKRMHTQVIIRGLRSNADLEYEQQLAAVNYNLAEAETVVLLSRPEMQYVSSSVVRELVYYNADVSKYVPKEAIDIISGRYS